MRDCSLSSPVVDIECWPPPSRAANSFSQPGVMGSVPTIDKDSKPFVLSEALPVVPVIRGSAGENLLMW